MASSQLNFSGPLNTFFSSFISWTAYALNGIFQILLLMKPGKPFLETFRDLSKSLLGYISRPNSVTIYDYQLCKPME